MITVKYVKTIRGKTHFITVQCDSLVRLLSSPQGIDEMYLGTVVGTKITNEFQAQSLISVEATQGRDASILEAETKRLSLSFATNDQCDVLHHALLNYRKELTERGLVNTQSYVICEGLITATEKLPDGDVTDPVA